MWSVSRLTLSSQVSPSGVELIVRTNWNSQVRWHMLLNPYLGRQRQVNPCVSIISQPSWVHKSQPSRDLISKKEMDSLCRMTAVVDLWSSYVCTHAFAHVHARACVHTHIQREKEKRGYHLDVKWFVISLIDSLSWLRIWLNNSSAWLILVPSWQLLFLLDLALSPIGQGWLLAAAMKMQHPTFDHICICRAFIFS